MAEGKNEILPLDEFDVKILRALERNCKASFNDIAAEVGLSPSACHKRLKAIEESGIISSYVAIIAEEKVGLKTNVFVQVTLKSQKEETLTAFENSVSRHREIMECYLMAGLSDYMLRILCKDAEDYERIHNQILTRLPGVDRVLTNFAIRKVLRRTAVPALPEA
jgi:DNA-binding Lrp family transcriptional regulator